MFSTSPDCLSDDVVAAWTEGRLSSSELERVEAHVATCSGCLRRAADAVRSNQESCASRTTALQTSEDAARLAWAELERLAEGDPATASTVRLGDAELGGELVGERFVRGAFIAQGGMGEVYAGYDRQTGQRVAIKRLKPGLALDPDSMARFTREGEILRRLDHPNIVKTLAVIEGQAQSIVMEYVSGGSLRQLLLREPALPLARSLRLTLEIADALSRAHHLTVIHRDVKPENVLLGEDGTPRLTDFGLARMGGRSATAPGTLLGTIAYLSPEIVWGHDADERSDVWALGVMLLEMLTGAHPFAAANVGATMQAITAKPFSELWPRKPAIPAALTDLLRRMLERERSQRVRSARQVGAELEAILYGLQAAEPAPSSRFSNHNLPSETTPFVGRASELADLLKLVREPDVRLITLLGPGGMGKTRLALEVGRRLLSSADASFTRGVFFVNLAPLAAPELFVSTIAEAIGFSFQPAPEPLKQLQSFLREKKLLLLLDNFEHLLPAAAVVHELLAGAPGVKVLVTSRQRLGLQSENVVVLSGLSLRAVAGGVQEELASAVQLFVESARRARAGFALATGELVHVTRICAAVQGMPLGILLAGSWAGVLSSQEIAEEIEQNLDFLQSDHPDLPERQHSLRAVFEHSFQLLTPPERALFTLVSVFRGGFTRAAAEFVAHADLATLAALVNKSLLRRNPQSGRYEIHELTRQYAEAKLVRTTDEHDAALARYAEYYARFLGERRAELQGANQRRALNEIAAEIANIRHAWQLMLDHQWLASVDSAIDAMSLFYEARASRTESEAQFKAVVEAFSTPEGGISAGADRVIGVALTTWASICVELSRFQEATELVERSLAALGESVHAPERAQALSALAQTAFGSMSKASTAAAEQSVALCRTLDDPWALARSLTVLGSVHASFGSLGRAVAFLQESVAIQEASNGRVLVSPMSLALLGLALCRQGQPAQGRECIQRGLAVAEELEDSRVEICLHYLAHVQRALGDYVAAELTARRSLALAQEFGRREAWSYIVLGDILKEQGRLDEALSTYRDAFERYPHDHVARHVVEFNLGDVALLRRELADASRYFEASLAGFTELGIGWGSALAHDGLGHVACEEADFERASAHFQRACRFGLVAESLNLLANTAAGVALLEARSGRARRAVELLALARSHSATEHQTRVRHVEPLWAELEGTLPAEEFAVAAAHGSRLDLVEALRAFSAEAADLVA